MTTIQAEQITSVATKAPEQRDGFASWNWTCRSAQTSGTVRYHGLNVWSLHVEKAAFFSTTSLADGNAKFGGMTQCIGNVTPDEFIAETLSLFITFIFA